MSDSSQATPFSYGLSEDRTKLRIELREAAFEYTADDVVRLLEFFANRRAEMIPTVPEQPSTGPTIEADRFFVVQDPEEGVSEIYARIPGLVWSCLRLSRDDSMQLAITICPELAPDSGSAKH